MTSTMPIARGRATKRDATEPAALIADAFADLHATSRLVPVPDRETKAAVLDAVFSITTADAAAYHWIEFNHDRTAVAVWAESGRAADDEPVGYNRQLERAAGPHIAQFRHLDGLFERHHPVWPHHHLVFVAVRPSHQGRGLGTALLAEHHRWLDEHHTIGYLEAAGERCRELYLRLGYTDRGRPFALPNGAQFYPMARQPHPPTASS